MSATQITLTDRHLESELQAQRKELGRLQEKLQKEQRTLDAARTEHNRIVEAIEHGADKQTEFARAKQDLETAEIRVGGLQKLVAPIEQKIRELTEEFDRRETAAAKACFEKEYGELQKKGSAIATAIREKLTRLIVEDIAEFDAIRIELGSRFAQLGGENAAFELRRLLFNPSGQMEGARDPNVHLATLVREGWEIRMAVPGDPLQLTIGSMSRTADAKLREREQRTLRP